MYTCVFYSSTNLLLLSPSPLLLLSFDLHVLSIRIPEKTDGVVVVVVPDTNQENVRQRVFRIPGAFNHRRTSLRLKGSEND